MYKHEFSVPLTWRNKQIEIVFEGSMTDTEVKINGRSVGATHQGAFYRFKYDITTFLNYGKNNLLEVSVSNRKYWDSIFAFFNEKMNALENFYKDYDNYIQDI